MKSPNTFRLFLCGLFASCLLLAGCEMPLLAGGSSSTETGEPIQISGRVVGNNGEGVSGVEVRLKANGASDVTGPDGSYSIRGKGLRSPLPGRSDLDTLLFIRADQRITAVSITNWNDTVPDLQIIQRGFMGSLRANGKTVVRIEGVLTGDGIAAGDSLVATFYHNVLSENYSGFMFFPAPGDSVRTYEVRVKVYGTNGALLKTSPTVGFTSQAGNILISDIDL